MIRGTDSLGKARYIGSISDGIVHDSDNAHGACRIEELMSSRQAIGFHCLNTAILGGYTPCGMCITAVENNRGLLRGVG